MSELYAFLITIVAGCFFLIAILINKFLRKHTQFFDFTLAMACIVAMGLIIFDLVPEAIEMLSENKVNPWLLLFLFAILGITIIKVLDKFIPAHNHHHLEKNDQINEHDNHVFHIGIISGISLFIHSFVEGILLYSVVLIDLKGGILLALSVALHNIPMGMQIYSSLTQSAKLNRTLLMTVLCLSAPLGAATMFLLNNNINEFLLGGLLAITTGMLIYIALFELLREIIKNSNKKIALLGAITGILLILLTFLL